MAHRLDGYAPYGDRIQVGVFDLPIYKPTVLGPAEPWIIEAINTVFDGIPLYRVVHICYEHEEGQPGYWISRQTALPVGLCARLRPDPHPDGQP
jgi:hypothetical protein